MFNVFSLKDTVLGLTIDLGDSVKIDWLRIDGPVGKAGLGLDGPVDNVGLCRGVCIVLPFRLSFLS